MADPSLVWNDAWSPAPASSASQRAISHARFISWSVALTVSAILLATLVLNRAFGLLNPVDAAYVTSTASAVVGALIATRHPTNRLGWLMLTVTFGTALSTIPFEYGYAAVVVRPGLLPFGSVALWLASWMWIPSFGLGMTALILRFPDGRVPHGWHFVDQLAIAGTVLFIVAMALTPGPLYPTYRISNPVGADWGRVGLPLVYSVGFAFIVAAAGAAVGSLVSRYRRANLKLRSQLKWVLLATAVVTTALAYTAVTEILFHPDLDAALAPFTLSLIVMPIAFGIATLRYHLYDVDLIINRTLVYALSTAVLGGMFVAGTETGQWLFVAYTGQKSEIAIVITAFVVATAFTPVQKWAEGIVDRRIGIRDPAGRLEALASSIEAVTRVIDPHQIACHVVDQAVTLFEAVGGAIYLESFDSSRPYHASGQLSEESSIEVSIRHAERSLGRLRLGHRRGGATYSEHDRRTIQRSADALGEAIAVAHHFGHIGDEPESKEVSR